MQGEGHKWLYRFEFLRTMCLAISMEPRGMVERIAAAVLKTFTMTNKDGTLHRGSHVFAN